MIENVLVPLDGSELAERALPYARVLAKNRAIRLYLIRAVVPGDLLDTGPVPDEPKLRADAEAYLEGLTSGRLGNASVRASVYYGEAAETILAEMRARKIDLLLMSTHGRSGLGRWIYGSVADQVLRNATVPVLLVPSACNRTWPDDRPIRIAVPLDGSDLAAEVLTPARDLAKALDGEIHLIRAVEQPSYAYVGRSPNAVDLPVAVPVPMGGASQAEAENYLGRIAAELRAMGQYAESHVIGGGAVSGIIDLSRDIGADVIAMATHGRGGVVRMLMGSVATTVLQQSSIPIMLVRPAVVRQQKMAAETG